MKTLKKALFITENTSVESNKHLAYLDAIEVNDLVDYIYKEHHQFYYAEEPALTELITTCINHLKLQDYNLERLECLVGNLTNQLTNHFLVEETVLFPHIKDMADAKKNGSVVRPSGIENISDPVKVMEVEHEASEAILEEIEAITDHYTPSPGAFESFTTLYQKLSALHKNLEQHIYIENHILYPKAMSLEKELMNLTLL